MKPSTTSEVIDLLSSIRPYKRGEEISPHKYILLLSLTKLLDHEKDHKNCFTFNEIEPVYKALFHNYFPDFVEERMVLEHPYYHLQKDNIWSLVIKKEKRQQYQTYKKTRLTRRRILETVEYAYLDNKVFQLLQKEESRRQFEDEILKILNKDIIDKNENEIKSV